MGETTIEWTNRTWNPVTEGTLLKDAVFARSLAHYFLFPIRLPFACSISTSLSSMSRRTA